MMRLLPLLQGAGSMAPSACTHNQILSHRSGLESTCPPALLLARGSCLLLCPWTAGGCTQASPWGAAPCLPAWLQAHLGSTCLLRVSACRYRLKLSAVDLEMPFEGPPHPAGSLATGSLHCHSPPCLQSGMHSQGLKQPSMLSALAPATADVTGACSQACPFLGRWWSALGPGQLSQLLCHNPHLPCRLLYMGSQQSAKSFIATSLNHWHALMLLLQLGICGWRLMAKMDHTWIGLQ